MTMENMDPLFLSLLSGDISFLACSAVCFVYHYFDNNNRLNHTYDFSKMAQNIQEMFVCEACGYIADRESILANIGNGVQLKLRSYKCDKCDNLSKHPSNQKKDNNVIYQREPGDNDIRNGKSRGGSKSESCHDFTNEIPTKPELNQNQKRRKQKLNVRCQQCPFSTSSTTLLVRHEKSDHSEDGGDKILPDPGVDSRGLILEGENNLKRQEAESEAQKTIQCPKCNFSTTKTRYLNRHIKHIHSKVSSFKCQDCEYKTNRKDKFKNHVKAIHEKVRDKKCPHCDHACSDTWSMKSHIKSKHLKIKDNHCQICEKAFSQSRHLKTHIKLVHAMVKDFHCPTCEYSTGSKPTLKLHIKVKHNKIKDMKCPHCNYSTGQPSSFRIHIKHVHTKVKDLKCRHCDYITSYPASLKVHIRSVHAMQRDHKCLKCDYKSAQLGNLKTHVKVVHDKIKDLKCPYCEYVSAFAHLVENHISSKHLQRSDCICKLCDKAFSSSHYLMSHMKRVHDKDPKGFTENTDGLTIYIKPKKDIQDDNLLHGHLSTNDKENPPSNNIKSDDIEEAESILGI